MDLFEPSGHGRRRKRYVNTNSTSMMGAADKYSNSTTNFAKFKENIEYTVIMPEDIYHGTPIAAENNCGTFLALSGVLGCLLFVAALILCYLTSRLQAAIGSKFRTQNDSFGTGRLHPAGQSSKFPVSFSGSSAYSGRLHWPPFGKITIFFFFLNKYYCIYSFLNIIINVDIILYSRLIHDSIHI